MQMMMVDFANGPNNFLPGFCDNNNNKQTERHRENGRTLSELCNVQRFLEPLCYRQHFLHVELSAKAVRF